MFIRVSGVVSNLRHYERQNGDRINVVELGGSCEVQLSPGISLPVLYSEVEYVVRAERSQYGVRLIALPEELLRAISNSQV